jgi:transcription elongation factor GreB
MTTNQNYITPEGFKRLQDELNHLIRKERPEVVKVISWAAGNGDRSENGDYIYGKKRLRQIDSRIKYLLTTIEDANIIHSNENLDKTKIFFGANVKLFDEDTGKELLVRIVGSDEISHEPGFISWNSPLARVLSGKSVDEVIQVEVPTGTKTYSILGIDYS